ncbi:hypothetical protein pipiens_019740 [Culex pipiens pipiens]|uniref:Uncharacterized protein n=1 Tax=Culex pipiens pipiens TaxID=38569 RepID=A0ABD1DSS5_CULPP
MTTGKTKPVDRPEGGRTAKQLMMKTIREPVTQFLKVNHVQERRSVVPEEVLVAAWGRSFRIDLERFLKFELILCEHCPRVLFHRCLAI